MSDSTSLPFIFLVLALFWYVGCDAARDLDHVCAPSSCGNIANISHPFRLKDDPQHCGIKQYELSCEDNVTVLYLYEGKYYVQGISYQNYTIRVVDSGLQTDNCSSLPSHSLTSYNFSRGNPYNFSRGNPYTDHLYAADYEIIYLSKSIIFVSCAEPVSSSIYVDAAPCLNGTLSYSYEYVMVGNYKPSKIEDSCRVELMAMTSSSPAGQGSKGKNVSFSDIHNQLVFGFELSWISGLCECHAVFCRINGNLQPPCMAYYGFVNPTVDLIAFSTVVCLCLVGARCILCGVPCFATLIIRKWRRRHLSAFDSVEDFLKCNNNLMPVRYSYSDIKKMTKSFKDKLGEGGFGSVYKGKLRSGPDVAIKVLSTAKGNGQDFINEVGTIGRIHHVNVVKLIGFCAERSKRALVYEFMPNGSLEKYIFQRGDNIVAPLTCKQMYEVALGVARGIEYLHRGCDIQILHFDIKPHNILLDDKFTPKVSDFGLAKLYPTEKSIVTLTAARGTMGYMAPELFYKNIGGVSYKADVYSFGMLLMEMAGRRKNLNAYAEHVSQIYFPSWVYEQLVGKREIDSILDEGVTEEEAKMVKKMMIAGLWCIQMKPEDRPSMNRVVEMLESEVESLKLPLNNPVDDSRLGSSNQLGATSMEQRSVDATKPGNNDLKKYLNSQGKVSNSQLSHQEYFSCLYQLVAEDHGVTPTLRGTGSGDSYLLEVVIMVNVGVMIYIPGQ